MNNLTHYKLIILNNDHYKILYNIEIIILIIPKINLLIILTTNECVVEISLKVYTNVTCIHLG
jgi:hypothetical protein